MSRALNAYTLLLALSGTYLNPLLAQAAGKKATKVQAPPPPPPPPLAPVADTPLVDSSSTASHSSSGDRLDLSEGRYGFSFGFPDGGSPFGAGFIGGRYFTAANTAVGGYLLLGSDSAAKTNSFGLAGKYQSYFAQRDRLNLYWFGQLTLGQNGGDANKNKDDLLYGIAGGAGIEYSLLKDFTFSIEGGLGFNTLPDSKSAYATGTGKLAVNFYY